MWLLTETGQFLQSHPNALETVCHIIKDWVPGQPLILYQLKCSVPKTRYNTVFKLSLGANGSKGNIDENNPLASVVNSFKTY